MDQEPAPAPGEDRSVALALANTLVEGSRGTFDRLTNTADLHAWLRKRGLAKNASRSTSLLSDITNLRSDVRSLLKALITRVQPSIKVVQSLNNVAGATPVRATLQIKLMGTVAAKWQPIAIDAPATTIARDLVVFLSSADARRLRICAADDCDRIFIQDHGRRIWCSDACGNRMRVQRHAARRRQVTAP
jgi:predicted RNA-binding Zn ribbon-like protein